MQIHATVVPGDRLYPSSGNQNRAVEKPSSSFDIQVANMPGSIVRDETFQTSNLTVRAANLISEHTTVRLTTNLPPATF